MTPEVIVRQLREFDTALFANTTGYIEPTPPHEYYMGGSIRSLTPSLEPTVGVAFTCELDSSTPRDGDERADDGAFYRQVDEMNRCGVSAVWVVKAVGSRPDHECVRGDGMAKLRFAAGCVGAVTDGGVRDIKGMLTTSFAVYARCTTIHHCTYRYRSFNNPVEMGGVVVHPGDVIHAGSEGVIRVPASCLSEFPERAIRMRAFEHDAHLALRRTDLTALAKRDMGRALLVQYGFARAKPAEERS